MINGIFTITSAGETGHYYAENFAELMQVLPLLWSVHTARDRVPGLRGGDADLLLAYSKSMLPICTTPSLRLFQPLEQARFEQLREDLVDGDTNLCHYALDYDGNRFAMTSWADDGIGTLSAPMDCVLSACAGAIQHRPSGQTYIDHGILNRALRDLATTEPEAHALEQTQPTGPTLRM